MFEYKIYKNNKDFSIFGDGETKVNPKGTRNKRSIVAKKILRNKGELKDNRNVLKYGFFKYSYYENCTEECSEKLAYEIGKKLKLNIVKTYLAEDEEGKIGVINYLFTNQEINHTDAKELFDFKLYDRKDIYTIENIKQVLDKYDRKVFNKFIAIMVFDALIGETDRHEENWGILNKNNKYDLSPIYDTGCNLLREYKTVEAIERFKKKDMKKFSENSLTCIYNKDKKRYKHFKLIEKLYEEYPQIVIKEINKIEKLKDSEIMIIVKKIPKKLMLDEHKKLIYEYILLRKERLINIINERGK